MKNLKKAIALLTLSILFTLNTQSTLAATGEINHMSSTGTTTEGVNQEEMNDDRNLKNRAQKIKAGKMHPEGSVLGVKLKNLRYEKRESLKENKRKIKSNRHDFKKNNESEIKNALKGINEDIREEMKELRNDFMEDVKELKQEYKEMEKNEDTLNDFRQKMQDLRKEFYNDMKELVGDNGESRKLLENRKRVYLENEDLREENIRTRVEFRGKRNDIVKKYKRAFLKRLENRLNNVTDAKLDRISNKIDSMIEKFENKDMNENKKDKILSQLLALKEIIDERLDRDDEEDLDIFEILEVE